MWEFVMVFITVEYPQQLVIVRIEQQGRTDTRIKKKKAKVNRSK